MKAIQLRSPPITGLTTNLCEGKLKPVLKLRSFSPRCSIAAHGLTLGDKKGVDARNVFKQLHEDIGCTKLFFSPETACGRSIFPSVNNQSCSDYGVGQYDAEERFIPNKGNFLCSFKDRIFDLVGLGTKHSGSVTGELIVLALPAIVGQAIEPLAQLMETAYIGRLGAVELASAGVSVSIFNIISKLFNFPLLSITTSFVAQDISKCASRESISDKDFSEENYMINPTSNEMAERKQLPSVSTALLLATVIGIFEALVLYFGAGLFLNLMGIPSASPMHGPSERFLSLRALGAPAVVVSLAIQGVLRGFKDTKTPLLCVGVGNLAAVFLLPILTYSCGLGITGAAISTVTSQYIMTFLLIWFLSQRAVLLPPKMENLQLAGYIKSGGLLLGRTLAVLITMTLGTSMAARQGPLAMAAHQICLQVWLAVSLISDALAISGQALIASSFSESDYKKVKEVTYCVLKMGLFTGVFLAIILGTWFGPIANLFTKDDEVLQIVKSGLLFVSATQPINALAFVFDGLHYGVSDFSYAARSMMVVGAISSTILLCAPSIFGLAGIWSGLAIFMTLRMAAGFMRLGSKTGPWWFLQPDFQKTEVSG